MTEVCGDCRDLWGNGVPYVWGGKGDKRADNVTIFRYLGRHLDQTDDDCSAVRHNIMRTRFVWRRLGTLL